MKAGNKGNNESKILLEILWKSTDLLRGKLNQSELFNYVLPLMFFKYISDLNEREDQEAIP